MNTENLIVQLGMAFVSGLAKDAEHDAYQQELHDSDHSGENVPTHVAHALGRIVGFVAKSGS
jgi:hypothetical protein